MADIMSCCKEPAKACITEPAKAAGKWICEQTSQRVTFLWCFDTNIKSLRDEAVVLDGATEGWQLQVTELRDNDKVIDPEDLTWIQMSKAIQVDTWEILREAAIIESHRLKVLDRSSVSKRAKEMTDRLEKHRAKKRDSVRSHSRPSAATRIDPRGETFECKSRNEIEEEIMKTLKVGDKNMIGIYGMGGLGKTTMATKIMNRALKENVCKEVVMAVVSHNVDISKIQDEIGRQLKLEKLKDKKLEQIERVDLLQCRLLQRKRTLLVLDDVWERLVLEHFGIPRDSEWCTILFTSRNRDVLRGMRVKTIFGMEVLSKEEAWSFFRERAGVCVDDRKLKPIAEQVAEECGRLPLALDVVGVGLGDQHSVAIWENALLELKQRVPDTVQFDNKEVYNPLKWSYNRLDSEPAKSIFLLCCLFPEDANIPVEHLFNFCMGLGVFECITNMRAARNKMFSLTQKLTDRSLLLESDKEDCVRMHDVIRDVCIVLAKEEGFIGKDGSPWISSSHLVGERNQLLSGSSCPNSRLLFLNSRYSSGFQFDDAFVEGMRELHVLCIHYYSLKTLPHPTHPLGRLNTLIFYSCHELKTISDVGKLINLKSLICRNCGSIKELPSEMKGLNRLKLLELTG